MSVPSPASPPEAPLDGPTPERSRRRPTPEVLAWLSPLVLLGAVGLGVGIVFARPNALVSVLLVLLACLPVVWVLTSALWPARAERGCPACGKDSVVRLDARTALGLRCRACGWRDESASAWLLAEEEGPLEELVLAQRSARRSSPSRSAAVETSRPKG